MSKSISIAILLTAALTQSTSFGQDDCDRAGDYRFVCGPQNAEDLVSVPGTDWVIASAMVPGTGLYLIDANTKAWSALYPTDVAQASHDMRTYGACPGTPDPNTLITHGLNLRPGRNGHSTLNVVSHGAREAIEVFDVDATGERPVLTWQGCVEMPHGLEANSVASFNDGTLVATVLLHPGTSFGDSLSGKTTGAVYMWSPGDPGFALIRGTELPSNNGIEVSADQREIYVASSGLSTIVAFARSNPSQQLRTTQRLLFTPDNVHMDENGQLITAGMINDEPACGGDPTSAGFSLAQLASCPRGSMAAAVDPATMEVSVVASASANRAFSNATMALVIGNAAWVGTFSGDKIAYIATD